MTQCFVCGWSRGHDYGCPNDPLNPGTTPSPADRSFFGTDHELVTNRLRYALEH